MNAQVRNWRRPAQTVLASAALALAAVTAGPGGAAQAQQAGGQPPACAQPPSPTPPAPSPTTITSIEQAYYCVFTNYYSGPELDDQTLLAGAFAGLTQELDQLGLDQPDATMPALTGNHDSDWAAFAAVYDQVVSHAHPSAAQQQDLAAATMTGMIASLHDDHAIWEYQETPPGWKPGDEYDLGISTSPFFLLTDSAPAEALPPLYVTRTNPGSPAASAGIRPGDVIESVNGTPPFADGQLSPGAISPLALNAYPLPAHVTLQLQRPATGHTWTVTLTPALYTGSAPPVSATLMNGNIAYVALPQFSGGAITQAMSAIASLGKQAHLRGLILDLRGNTGGSPDAEATLLGAFEHGQAISYDCDVQGNCTANYPDASTPLLHLPLVVLTSRNCFSACEAFSGAVKDLHLGTLVGTRTAGIVSGPLSGYLLDDGSVLGLPAKHELSADHEIINGIGVAPDYYIPLTAWDVSTGHDPDLAKALTLLRG